MTADRAPFCFALPAGFRDSSSRPDYGYGWQWRALVSAGPHDLIEVVAQPVRTRLTALDDAGRRRFVDQLRLRPDALHVLDAGPLTATTVAGAKAFAQDATYRLDPAPPPSFGPPSGASSSAPTADVSVAVHSLIVLASAAVVYVSCQATAPRAATVATACREVQASLHVS